MIQSGSRDWWRITLALCLGSFMVFNNLYVTQPLLPTLARDFGISELEASHSFTVSTLTMALALLVFGPLSDVLGRKWLMLGSMLGILICTLALSQAQNYAQLLALRALQGFFLGGLPAIAVAYMADEFEPTALMSAVGFYIAANSLGGIGGRVMGGWAGDAMGWNNAFIVVGGLGLVIWLTVSALLPKPSGFQPRPLRPASMAADLWMHLKTPSLLMAFVFGGLQFFIFINQYSYITFRLAAAPYSLTANLLGLLFLTYLSGTLASTLSGRFTRRYGQPACMAAGSLILIMGSLVTLFDSIWLIVTGLLINSFGFFFAHSSASGWVSRNAQHAKASASSLYLVFYYLGASTGGLYLHPFWQEWQWPGVVASSIVVLLINFAITMKLKADQSKALNEKADIGGTDRAQGAPPLSNN
ncbi:MAG: MFS transporter [Oceanobacter sp.]